MLRCRSMKRWRSVAADRRKTVGLTVQMTRFQTDDTITVLCWLKHIVDDETLLDDLVGRDRARNIDLENNLDVASCAPQLRIRHPSGLTPSNTMLPLAGSTRRIMPRASVDFPQPDSPTKPRTSPRLTDSRTRCRDCQSSCLGARYRKAFFAALVHFTRPIKSRYKGDNGRTDSTRRF